LFFRRIRASCEPGAENASSGGQQYLVNSRQNAGSRSVLKTKRTRTLRVETVGRSADVVNENGLRARKYTGAGARRDEDLGRLDYRSRGRTRPKHVQESGDNQGGIDCPWRFDPDQPIVVASRRELGRIYTDSNLGCGHGWVAKPARRCAKKPVAAGERADGRNPVQGTDARVYYAKSLRRNDAALFHRPETHACLGQ